MKSQFSLNDQNDGQLQKFVFSHHQAWV